jgi:penicillin amidase
LTTTVRITPDTLPGAFKEAIPQLDGTITVPGLTGPVEVVRDSLGIPHIKATTTHDVFFAQGFVHAQDRLWHMEYDRRRAMGRWAECVGEAGVDQDRLMRKAQLAESARRDYGLLNAETRAMLDAYAEGVNAFIQSSPVLPIEFRLLEITPEPWEAWHCGAVFKVRHGLMGSFGNKLWRLRILKTIGQEWIERLRASSGDEMPLIVPPGRTYQDVPDGYGESEGLKNLILALVDVDGGSNNWAVSGSKTASGKPLLAGDPHRALDVPNVYYQHHLTCPEFDAIGYAFVGSPGITHFGHNQHVAWGVTTANSDSRDFFVERFADGDPTTYQYKGAWLPADRHTETISVRGGASVEVDVTVTRHGPIMVGDPKGGTALALAYPAITEPNHSFESILPMLRATTVDELDEAKRPWVDPDNNFVMADTAGTIGYLTRGEVPIRPKENAWLPVPGWSGEYEWTGTVPFDEMPRARTPEQGFIATANQRIIPADFPHYISADWSPPYRGARVNARLRPMTSATPADMTSVHADKLSIPSAAFVELARALTPHDAASAEARDRLLAWDRVMGPSDVPPTIYAVWREQISAAILSGPLFAPLVTAGGTWDLQPSQSMPLAQRLRNVIYGLMKARDEAVLPPGETWESVGASALAKAIAWLTDTLGPDQAGWEWGKIHRTRPRHPLSAVFPELAELLDPPSVGVGGDGDTPQAASYACADGTDYTLAGTSVTRYCFDLSDWDNSGWVSPLGASGHPGSPHFADQVPAWAEQRLHPMLYSWDKIEAAAESRQCLEPA